MSGYRLIFEESYRHLPWWPLLIGLVAVFVGWLLFETTDEDMVRAKIVGGGIALVGTFWLIAFVAIFYRELNYVRDYRSGRFEVVEGTITRFHPMPASGHDTESFTVNGHHFRYSNFTFPEPCFDQTAIVGGPLREGKVVRVGYSEDCIVKLEIAETTK